MEIRKAVPGDAVGLAELLLDIGWFDALNCKSIETIAAQVEQRIAQCRADESHALYVAVGPDAQIAGYGSAHWVPYLFMTGPEGYVSELFVRSNARGQGVGRQLLAVIEADARARGCARLSLINLRTRESYLRKFYVKAGWRERAEAANFIYPLGG